MLQFFNSIDKSDKNLPGSLTFNLPMMGPDLIEANLT